MKRKRTKGQGLVEFALILPILLLVVVGTIEVARIFLIYVNVSNAAREASRYGMVNPTDTTGINNLATTSLLWMPAGSVNIGILYDRGPGTATFTNPEDVTVGNRVIVIMDYPVDAITPIFQPFVPSDLQINVRNSRTVQSLKPDWTDPLPPPGSTSTNTPTITETPADTLTPTITNTPDPGATATNTPLPPLTPTPTPLPPIIITKPLWANTTIVQGTAAPNRSLTLRIVQTGYQITGFSDASGNFNFNVWPVLVAGHTVIVQGYGQQDLAIVQAVPTPTPTLPTTQYIRLDPTCTNGSTASIHVTWGNWSPPASTMYIYWNNDFTTLKCSGPINQGAIGCTFNVVNLTGSSYNVTGIARKSNGQEVGRATQTFERPCVTPTPTPVMLSDLQITGISLKNAGELGTYETLNFAVSVRNSGPVDVASLFWVDLYANPTGVLTSNVSLDYVAINALASNSTITFTMFVPRGFDTVGNYTMRAMVDTWNQIAETNETNNISAALPITITKDNPPPTPLPVVTPGPTGGIEGVTYLGVNRQDNVSVYVYDTDGRLWGSTRSSAVVENIGYYLITNLPSGDYVVVGQLRIADILYIGQMGPVTVLAPQVTDRVDIYLDEVQ